MPLTEYLLFARSLDRGELFRNLFLQVFLYIVWAVFIAGTIIAGDGGRCLWPEIGGKLRRR